MLLEEIERIEKEHE